MKDEEMKEAISALADGEHDEVDTSRLVDELIKDPDTRTAWERYHLLSDAIGDRLPRGLPVDLAARVHEHIASEPLLFVPPRRRLSLLKPVAGLALAASVAAVAILGVRVLQRDAVQPPTVTVSTLPSVVVAGNRWNVSQPAVEARLNGYLVNHSEYLGHGMRGMVPYARIVGYDTAE